MKAPSEKKLIEAFDLSSKDAKLIRAFAKAEDDPDSLEQLVSKVPETEKYVRSLYSSPYDSDIWRVTVVLHAINEIVGGHGVEALGQRRSGDFAPEYEYVNMGDPYIDTLIYSRNEDKLSIGGWGDIVEEVESDAETEAWDNWVQHEFESALEQHYELDDFPEDVDSLRLFSESMDPAQEYWHIESDGSAYINVSKVANAAIDIINNDKKLSRSFDTSQLQFDFKRSNNPREANVDQSDVIGAWIDGKKKKASALSTDGNSLYSYDLLIGERVGDVLMVYDYTGPYKVSVTTTKHVNMAKRVADQVVPAPRYNNPPTSTRKLKTKLMR